MLPNTLEDLLALGLAGTGAAVSVLNLPARRAALKFKLRRAADALGDELEAVRLTAAEPRTIDWRSSAARTGAEHATRCAASQAMLADLTAGVVASLAAARMVRSNTLTRVRNTHTLKLTRVGRCTAARRRWRRGPLPRRRRLLRWLRWKSDGARARSP